MKAGQSQRRQKEIRTAVVSPDALSPLVEYAYFGLVLYSIFLSSGAFSVPLLGAGGMGLLAIYCIRRLKGPFNPIYAPLRLPVACAIAFVLIQTLAHDQSLMESNNRNFVTWVVALVIVRSLLLRTGFLRRFGLVAGLTGLLLLVHLDLNWGDEQGGVARAGLEAGVAFGNPNDLAAWFGFCCVYFIVVGIEHRRDFARLCSFVAASACLFVVAWTVSRSTLMAVVIAAVIAFRRVLKRGFFPVLLLAVVGSTVLISGLLDRRISLYLERGTEETGRFLVWPLALERIVASPLVGVGVSEIGTLVLETGDTVTPHNAFLYVGLAAGIIPLALFVAYWIKALTGAFYFSRTGLRDAPFQLPLIIYTLIIVLFEASAFMHPWAIVTLCNAMCEGAVWTIARRVPRHNVVSVRPKQPLYIRSLKY